VKILEILLPEAYLVPISSSPAISVCLDPISVKEAVLFHAPPIVTSDTFVASSFTDAISTLALVDCGWILNRVVCAKAPTLTIWFVTLEPILTV